MEVILYGLALAVIAVACLLGVFYHDFTDNLIQRIGLSVTCLGAAVWLVGIFNEAHNDTRVRHLLTYGVAIYCVGTLFKLWRKIA